MKASRATLTALGLVTVGFFVLYRHVAAKLVFDWANDGNYSHGFFIIPLSIYLAWERRRQLAAASIRPAISGLVVIAGSVLVLLAGLFGAELFLSRISAIGVVAGIVLFLFGWSYLRVLAFPIAFLLLMIPLPAIVFNQIALPLQLIASRFGESVIGAANIPVLREGNVLVMANTSLEVADACSGIRSLVSLITLGILVGYFADTRFWVRALIVVATIPVAVIANGLRVAGTGIAAHRFGPAMAEGFFHEFSGWAVFVVSLLMLVGLLRLFIWLAPPARQEVFPVAQGAQ